MPEITPTGIVLKSDIEDIADAIRLKTNTQTTMSITEMPTKIDSINSSQCELLTQSMYDNINPLELENKFYAIID